MALYLWSRDHGQPSRAELAYSGLQMSLDGEPGQLTFNEVTAHLQASEDDPGAHWSESIAYLLKVLLYLSLDRKIVQHEQPYTLAPRQFSGLGQRKRHEKLAEIEKLYDRYLVGPELLPADMGAGGHMSGPGDGYEVRPHWRRGHFRMQLFGPEAR